MKKQKKILVQLLVFLAILLSNCKVFAEESDMDLVNSFVEMQFSQDYLDYLELTEEEKASIITPRMYEIPKATKAVTNVFRLARMLGSSLEEEYSLRKIIPANMVIKNQQNTGSCWTFSSLATLETNLALQDYYNKNDVVIYDFSERHMEYATSQSFLDNAKNEVGFNRSVGGWRKFRFCYTIFNKWNWCYC